MPTGTHAEAPGHGERTGALPPEGDRAVPPLPGRAGASRGRDERRFALRVLDAILGGSSSSRLFQEVREKRGLAYSVYSYTSQYVDSGQVAVYVGTRPDSVGEAMEVIGTELRKLQEHPGVRGGAAPRQGERQGPDRAGDGVHARAHEPARLAPS